MPTKLQLATTCHTGKRIPNPYGFEDGSEYQKTCVYSSYKQVNYERVSSLCTIVIFLNENGSSIKFEFATWENFELRKMLDLLWSTYYNRIHMCIKCHEEFLKVERLYDNLDGSESNFDAVREQFAFTVVESVIKSQYINNYVHGNAFDAIRYLVFKEWGGKFRKQNQISKSKLEKAKQVLIPSMTGKSLALNRVGVAPENNIQMQLGKEKPTVSATSEKDLKQVRTLVQSTNVPPISDTPDKTKALKSNKKDTRVNRFSNMQTNGNNSSTIKSNSTAAETTISVENGADSAKPLGNLLTLSETTRPFHSEAQIKTNANSCSSAEQRDESIPKTPDMDLNAELGSTEITDKPINSLEPDPEFDCVEGAKPSTSSSSSASSLPPEASNAAATTDPTSNPKSSPPVSIAQNNTPVLPQSTYILSPDGRKLISKCGKLSPKQKLIFVKRDPVTGRMVRVPKPNFSMVKGKFNGREVIVRSTPSSIFQPQTFLNSSGSSTHVKTVNLPVESAVSSFPVKNVVTEPGSPSVPRIVSVQSIPTASSEGHSSSTQFTDDISNDSSEESAGFSQVESNQQLNSSSDVTQKPSKVSPDGKRQSTDDNSKSKGEPPEVRSIRSGRRIKRVYDSSSWASGLEMDQLVAQSLKDGRTDRSGYSPKRATKINNKVYVITVKIV
ncbi:unnamed protein product [Allacma fusca]|uniref:Uncharacterized protein n=1 Tax=Allacma fusca TaxID=39272 RepID=A0A8J2LG86_9HEXA|nr:unnamed protein product [Allacma fusca]